VAPAAATDPGQVHDHDHDHDHDHAGHEHGAAAPAGPSVGGLLDDWQTNVSRPSVAGASSVVNELRSSAGGGRAVRQLAMALAGVAGAIGLLLAVSWIKSFTDVFRASFALSFVGGGTIKVGLVLVVVVGLLTAALWLAIAWLARAGSRATVPLVYVAGAATLLGDLTTGPSFYTGLRALEVISALLALAAVALLFVPEVRDYLAGGPTGRPESLVASEALLYFFGLTALLLGLAYIFFATAFHGLMFSSGDFWVAAIGLLAAGVAGLVFAGAVGRGAVQARVIVTGIAVVFFILQAVAGNLGGSWFHVVLVIGVAALLWTAADARVAFGDAPLNVGNGMSRPASTPPVPPGPGPYEQPAGGEPPVA
jgi:hypothetical protein